MKTYLFDDRNSYAHAVLGLISALIPYYCGIFIIILFVIYEVKEPENAVSTLGDILEFLIGLSIGMIITS